MIGYFSLLFDRKDVGLYFGREWSSQYKLRYIKIRRSFLIIFTHFTQILQINITLQLDPLQQIAYNNYIPCFQIIYYLDKTIQIFIYFCLYFIFNSSSMGQSNHARQIHITIQAGQTQSQELYDFNSSDHYVVANQIITNDSFIVQDGTNIKYAKEIQDFSLFNVKIKESYLELARSPTNKQHLWRVIQPAQQHMLQLGSVIKIGKIQLRLKELVQDQKQQTEKDFRSKSINLQQIAQAKSISNKSNVSNPQIQCRVCFDSANGLENPLVCLCMCSGSVKYIHYACLKDWINNKIQKRQHNNALFFSYQSTKCQICQHFYQPQFLHKGRKYMLLNLQNAPNVPYAVFEQLSYQPNQNKFSVFFIGLQTQQQIIIGRNSSSTIVLKQISVSRNHCTLKYKNKNLFIQDKGSKFGTLIKVNEELQFNPRSGIKLQYQSKLITIEQKGNIGCCCTQGDSFLLKIKQNIYEKEIDQI